MKASLATRTGWLLLTAAIILFVGCSPDDVPPQSDEGHIENYILNEDKAVDLFRTVGIFPGTPYQWPGDSAIYYDSVLSVDRVFETVASTEKIDYGYLGFLREAIVRVSDNFQVRTYRIDGWDTTFTDANRLLVRSGFFLKLADDRQYYLGWDLWGMGYFNQSLPAVTVGLWFADSTSIRGDFDLYNSAFFEFSGKYRKLSDFRTIEDSTEMRLDVQIANLGIPARYITMITYTSHTGYVRKRLDLIDADHSTVTINLHELPEIAYDFIVISTFDANTREYRQSWTIPYRVNPIL